MIHFDFMLTEEDAELLFECVQQEIVNLKYFVKLDDNMKRALDAHIKRLEYIKEKMHNKKVG